MRAKVKLKINMQSIVFIGGVGVLVIVSIIVVIMIKSSDPQLSNTYRIIRVLSTHDYLATDHLRSHFIFSHLQTPEPPSAPLTAPPH